MTLISPRFVVDYLKNVDKYILDGIQELRSWCLGKDFSLLLEYFLHLT